MRNYLVLSLFALSLAITAGCSSSGSNDSGIAPTTTGKLYYPNMKAAKVCVDENNNNFADDKEQCVDVSSDGSYNLGSYDKSKSLVAVITETNAPALKNVNYKAIDRGIKNILSSPANMSNISIFTTYIKSAIDNNPLLTLKNAENQVKVNLNLADDIKLNEITAENTLLKDLSVKSGEALNTFMGQMDVTQDNLLGVISLISSITQNVENKDKPVNELITSEVVKSVESITESIKSNQTAKVLTPLELLNTEEAVYSLSYFGDMSQMIFGGFIQKRGDKLFSNILFHSGSHLGNQVSGSLDDFFNNIKDVEYGQQLLPPGYSNPTYLFDNKTNSINFYFEDNLRSYIVGGAGELMDGYIASKVSIIDIPADKTFTTGTTWNDLTSRDSQPVTTKFPIGSKKIVISVDEVPVPFDNFTAFDKVHCFALFNTGGCIVVESDEFYDIYSASSGWGKYVDNKNEPLIHVNYDQMYDNGTMTTLEILYNLKSKEHFVYNQSCLGLQGSGGEVIVAKEECKVNVKPITVITGIENLTHPSGLKYWNLIKKYDDGDKRENIFWKDADNKVYSLSDNDDKVKHFDFVFFNRVALDAVYEAVKAVPVAPMPMP